MTINTLFTLLIVAIAVAIWLQHSRISARAAQLALQACRDHDVQMLDQTVLLVGLKLASYRGMPCLQRRYRFEFSNKGDRRYYGWVTLNAWVLQTTELQPFSEHNLH